MTTLLKRGSRGAAVRDLQTLLNAAGAKPQLIAEKVFGDATEIAVRALIDATPLPAAQHLRISAQGSGPTLAVCMAW